MKTNSKKEFDKPDFIEVYPKAFPKDYCEELIRIMDELDELGMLVKRHGLSASDSSFALPMFEHSYKKEHDIAHLNKIFLETFREIFWDVCYPQYKTKYGVLEHVDKHSVSCVKAQKTNPGEGYHTWHCENGDLASSRRLLAWTVYLNDDFDAGETEFLYQQRRIKPGQGDLLIFPSSFTHTHRGNPPMNGAKYILTSWVEF